MGCGENLHPGILQVFDGGRDLCHPSWNVVLLLFSIFLGRESSSVFHLASPTIITLTLHVRKLIMDTLLVAEYFYSFMHSRTGEPNNQFWDPLGPMCDGLELMLH